MPKGAISHGLRILRSIVTRDEVIKEYPDKAILLLREFPDRIIQKLWNALGRPAQSRRPVQAIGRLIHRRARRTQDHEALSDYTRFFRNPSQLEVLRDTVLDMDEGAKLKLAVLGCSSGAELYSALWTIRTARPDLITSAIGIDISRTCIDRAIDGTYPVGSRAVEGITETTYPRLFNMEADTFTVQEWLREGVTWKVASACSAALLAEFGLQDLVFADNFLCHLPKENEEPCLRSLAGLVAPNGMLFVSCVDFDVKARMLASLGFVPVTARLEDVYMEDRAAREAWPLKYWGIEPLDKRRPAWTTRYARIFRRADSERPEKAEHSAR